MRLWTQTRVKGCPQRYLHCPSVCASQWIISDKVIRPSIHMLLGVFSNPTSPLPGRCPFREVVNTVVGVAAKRDSFLNTFQIPLIRSTLLCLASFHQTLQSTLWVSDMYSQTHPHALHFIIKWACIYSAFNIYGLLKVLVRPLNPKRHEKFHWAETWGPFCKLQAETPDYLLSNLEIQMKSMPFR